MSTSYAPTRIEVFRPAIGQEEIDAVAEVMRSGWIGRGPVTERFEAEWAKHIGVPRENVFSIGCATEGLYLIMAWLAKLVPFGEVIIPANSFIGTAGAVLEAGLALKLADIDRRALNPSVVDYDRHLAHAVVAIVKQHYGGFDQQHYQVEDAMTIEDMACHPIGKPTGAFAVWSFDAMKILSTGDGGMVYCRNPQLADELRQSVRLGMSSESGQAGGSERWWEFTARTPGRRSVMNDIQAAIGLVQLKRLPNLVACRADTWDSYQSELPDTDWLVTPPEPAEWEKSSYYTYWVQLPGEGHRDRLAVYLRERGIYTTFRYWPIHRAYGWSTLDCPNADWAGNHTLNLPLHPGLSNGDVDYICATIREFGRTL